MQIKITLADIKLEAKELKLKEKITLSEAQHKIANKYNCKNYQILKSKIDNNKGSILIRAELKDLNYTKESLDIINFSLNNESVIKSGYTNSGMTTLYNEYLKQINPNTKVTIIEKPEEIPMALDESGKLFNYNFADSLSKEIISSSRLDSISEKNTISRTIKHNGVVAFMGKTNSRQRDNFMLLLESHSNFPKNKKEFGFPTGTAFTAGSDSNNYGLKLPNTDTVLIPIKTLERGKKYILEDIDFEEKIINLSSDGSIYSIKFKGN